MNNKRPLEYAKNRSKVIIYNETSSMPDMPFTIETDDPNIRIITSQVRFNEDISCGDKIRVDYNQSGWAVYIETLEKYHHPIFKVSYKGSTASRAPGLLDKIRSSNLEPRMASAGNSHTIMEVDHESEAELLSGILDGFESLSYRRLR